MSERSPVEVLRAARERIADPQRWTTGAYARDCEGKEVEPNAEAACCWCAVGALFAELGVSGEFDEEDCRRANDAFAALVDAASADELGNLAAINDTNGLCAVLRVYDYAIATELGEEQGA